MGFGLVSCAEASAMLERPTGRAVLLAWAGGFMSGANATSTVRNNRYRDLSSMNAELIAGSIKAYCGEHSGGSVIQAVEALFAPIETRPFKP